MMDNNWILIDNPDHNFYAPPGKWLEVCGDSGYVTQRWFIINAIFERDDWYDATGTRLSETGWTPLYWRRMSSVPSSVPKKAYPVCDCEWTDARNEVVQSGEICLKCGTVRAGNEGAK